MIPRWQSSLVVLACWVLWGLFNTSRLRFVADVDWPTALRFGLPDAMIWALLTPIPVYLVRRLPFDAGRWRIGIAVHLSAAVALSLTHSALDALLSAGREPAAVSSSVLFVKITRYTFHHNVMLYAVIVGIAYYLAHQRRLHERDLHASELRARLSEARLSALRMQLRPHFLFNVLHTISGLAEIDAGKSRKVVRQLGELLRMSLVAEDVKEIPLERELRFARLYLELERTRLGDRLEVEVDVAPGTEQCAVPVLILQPLVENAVLHGIARRIGPGSIRIGSSFAGDRLELTVWNDGPEVEGRRDRNGSGGIGLTNTRARLEEMYGGDQELTLVESETGLQVRISLPLRGVTRSTDAVA